MFESSQSQPRPVTYSGALPLSMALRTKWGRSPSARLLLLRPLWPGFMLNTLLYAAALWFVFFAPFKLRRHLRTRRGLCPACGYPVGGAAVCSECGKALLKRRSAEARS